MPRRRSRSRSTDRAADELGRLHICNFDDSLKKGDLEDAFKKFGSIHNVWLASYPPLFAFVTFKNKDEADEALREMDNAYVCAPNLRLSQKRTLLGILAATKSELQLLILLVSPEIVLHDAMAVAMEAVMAVVALDMAADVTAVAAVVTVEADTVVEVAAIGFMVEAEDIVAVAAAALAAMAAVDAG
uniref:RRM domain-containing protein n=1 Tax=Ascaris lumbricoides TaxID=6252 RepID=A0A0M3HFR2_ASCLU